MILSAKPCIPGYQEPNHKPEGGTESNGELGTSSPGLETHRRTHERNHGDTEDDRQDECGLQDPAVIDPFRIV